MTFPPGLWTAVMESHGWLCVRCGQRADSLDHRLPRSRGGPHDAFNLQPLCGSGTTGCHGWVEEHPEEAQAAGLKVAGYLIRGVYVGPDPAYRAHYQGAAA